MARILTLLATALVAALPIGAASAVAADANAGHTFFKSHCAICHSDAAKGPQGIGPRLFGVAGRKAGTQAGYSYSTAMAKSGLTWSPDKLSAYLAKPAAVVPGNKMPFAGIPAEADRANVVAYLETLR